MSGVRVLAVSVATNRIGYVFLAGTQLVMWRSSRKAVKSTTEAAGCMQELINVYQPNVVVTEKISDMKRKGAKARLITEALQRSAGQNYVLDVSVSRNRRFPNKHAEAQMLVEHYPALRGWIPPKRKHYDPEPYGTVFFDALALAHTVIETPTKKMESMMK